MRVAHAAVLASTAIVATCVIVTLALLSREPLPPYVSPTLPPPQYLVPVIGPTHGFSLPDGPTVPCPRFDAQPRPNDHAWIDPLGRRHELRCGPNHSTTRTRGADGAFGTDDDVCFDSKASCQLAPPTPPDNF
jgi:hypothetical protein